MGKGLINILKRKEFKEDLKLSFFVILSVSILFVPLVFGLRGIFHDDLGFDAFLKYFFLADSFQHGHIPLWDPHTWCGAIPFYARYYAETYYVPQWPFFFFANLGNLQNAFIVLMLIPLWGHFCAAAIGMGLFLKKVAKLGFVASFLGACAYVLVPAMSTSYGWQQVIYLQTWLVWLLSFHYFSVSNPRHWKNGVCALLFFLILSAANPGIWQFVFFLWGGFCLFCAFNVKVKKAALRSGLSALFTVLLGGGMAAVYLYGFAHGGLFTSEHIELTTRAAVAEAGGSLHPAFLATVFVPWLFGNISGAGMSAFAPFTRLLYWESNLAGGMFFSLLVFCGMVGVFFKNVKQRFDSRRIGAFCLIIYVFAVFCALGRYTPFYEYVVGFVPGLGRLPRPIRYRYLQCFAACVLAAQGFDFLSGSFFGKIRQQCVSRKILTGYLLLSAFVLGLILVWPLGGQRESIWIGKPAGLHEGNFFAADVDAYLPKGAMPGKYAGHPKKVGPFADAHKVLKVDKVGFYCSMPGRVEILQRGRLNDSFLADIDVIEPGWQEVGIDAEPGSFIFIRSSGPEMRFGKRFVCNGLEGCFVKIQNGQWAADTGFSSMALRQLVVVPSQSTWSRVWGDGAGVRGVIIYLGMSFLVLIFCGYFLPVSIYSKIVLAVAFLELWVVAVGCFYFSTFAFGLPASNHQRVLRPGDHPLAQAAKSFFTSVPDVALFRFATDQPFIDNFARLYGGACLFGYDMHPLETRFKLALEKAYGQPVGYGMYYNRPFPRPEYRNFLSNFSVRYFLSDNPVKSISHQPTRKLSQSGFYVHQNPDAPARIYWQDNFTKASAPEQLEMLCREDLKNTAVVDELPARKLVQSAGFDSLQRLNSIGSINFSDPNRIVVECSVKKASMLICTDVYYPGWKVFVDGVQIECVRVNFCQKGVWVDEGKHTVEFVFSPPAFFRGGVISLFFLCLFAGWMLFGGKLTVFASNNNKD